MNGQTKKQNPRKMHLGQNYDDFYSDIKKINPKYFYSFIYLLQDE